MSKKSYENENSYNPDGDYTSSSSSDLEKHKKDSNRKVLFSDFQKNEFTTSRNIQSHGNGSKIKKVSDNEADNMFISETSLDEDLYGTSDKFCITLQKLKSELHNLNLDIPTLSTETKESNIDTKENLNSDDFLCEDDLTKDFACNIDIKISNFLFDKETNTSKIRYIKENLFDTIQNDKANKNCCFLSDNVQISLPKDKVNQPLSQKVVADVDSELSSASSSTEVLTILEPVKMSSSTSFSSSAHPKQNYVSLSYNLKNSESNIKNTIKEDFSRTELETRRLRNYFDSNLMESSLTKSTLNTRTVSPYLQKNEKRSSSLNAIHTKRDKVYIEKQNFIVELPSSAGSDYTSSDNFSSKLSITTLEGDQKSKRLHKRRNKIVPTPQSGYSSNTSLSDESQKLNRLFLKYYNDTPLLSSNSISTPPPNVSTCASGYTTETTPRSNSDSVKSETVTAINSVISHSSKQITKSINAFNPIYSSSLEVPKKKGEILNFPPITKITSFIHYPEVELRMLNIETNSQCSSKRFSSLAKKIKQEICTSNTIVKENRHTSRIEDLNKSTNDQNTQVIKQKPITKQYEDFSYYALSSTVRENLDHNCKADISALHSNSESDDENTSKCSCICNWLFPKKRYRFFY